MTEALDPILAHLILKWGLPGMALVGAITLLAVRLGWVSFKLPALRRKDDQVLELMMGIVKENTSAFVALKASMDDNKMITIKVSSSLEKVQEALAALSGHVTGALQVAHDATHHREPQRRAG